MVSDLDVVILCSAFSVARDTRHACLPHTLTASDTQYGPDPLLDSGQGGSRQCLTECVDTCVWDMFMYVGDVDIQHQRHVPSVFSSSRQAVSSGAGVGAALGGSVPTVKVTKLKKEPSTYVTIF